MKLDYVEYQTIEEKVEALFRGEVLIIRKFSQPYRGDVLIRLNRGRYKIMQMCTDLYTEDEGKYWNTFNIGFNDLSIFPAYKYLDGLYILGHKFFLGDEVEYTNSNGDTDLAIVLEVHQYENGMFSYRISGETNLFEEKYINMPTFR